MARTRFTVPHDLAQLLRTDNYPGMIPAESIPMRGFIYHHGGEFDELWFDFRVGEAANPGDQVEEAVRRVWAKVTRMRPDMVAWKAPDQATIVEAKEELENSGIWQLKTYADAYRAEFPAHKVRLVAVAQRANQTALNLAREAGVAVYLYTMASGIPDIAATPLEGDANGV